MPEPSESGLSIRRAVPDDAAAIVSVLSTIAAERIHSAIDRAWTVEQERSYLQSLSVREVIHVALDPRSEIAGLQTLDRWSSLVPSERARGRSNARALAFYRGIGFRDCGRLARQVVIDGHEDDEVLMEMFV